MNKYYDLDTTKLKYVLYCRKSSEGEDKQVQSLETQLRELKEHAEKNKLNIIDIISESKSAFKIGREGFNKLTDHIRTGRANAILVIRGNRISRNSIDAGYIISLMDEKKLLYIRTPHSTCYTGSSTDKMMLALELIFSKKDSDDKGDMVKEGLKTKALKGLPSGVATLGFINDKTEEKGNRKWLVDNLRLKKISILFEMFLTGTYSAGKLYKYAIQELKLNTVKRKKIGGALIATSRIYEILTDPIYAGFFFQGGERYELDSNLPRLITEDQHNRVKAILANKNIPKAQHNEATFAGFVQSDKGDFVGQDVKYQLICDCKNKFGYLNKTHCPKCGKEIAELEHPNYLKFTYYYNVKRKKNFQGYKSISETRIIDELLNFVDENLTFSLDFAEWSKTFITELRDKDINDSIFKKQREEADKSEFESKKARLRQMLRDEQITNEEYQSDLKDLNNKYSSTGKEEKAKDWYSKMNNIANLLVSAKDVLINGTMQSKRNVLSELSSNLVWNEENLSIHNSKEINKLVEGIKGIKSKFPKFEPKNYQAPQGPKEKTDAFSPVFSMMLRG